MSVRNDDGTYHSEKTMNIEARPLNLKPHNLPQDPNDFRPLLTQIWKNGKLISEEKN